MFTKDNIFIEMEHLRFFKEELEKSVKYLSIATNSLINIVNSFSSNASYRYIIQVAGELSYYYKQKIASKNVVHFTTDSSSFVYKLPSYDSYKVVLYISESNLRSMNSFYIDILNTNTWELFSFYFKSASSDEISSGDYAKIEDALNIK